VDVSLELAEKVKNTAAASRQSDSGRSTVEKRDACLARTPTADLAALAECLVIEAVLRI
jgi:hypothetical protein